MGSAMRLTLAALPLLALTVPASAQDYSQSLRVIPYSAPGLNAPTAPLFTQANPGYVTGGTGSSGSSTSTAPTGTAGTAATGTNAASPVYDATTGKGLLTAGTALPAGANQIGTVGIVGTVPTTLSGTPAVADTNSAAFGGVVAMTPGTATTALRSVGFVITAAGNVTFTFADGSTITLAEPASTAFTTLPFSVTTVALGTGTAGTFWELK